MHARVDVLELEHQRVVDGEPTGRVVDDEVDALHRGLERGVATDVDRVGAGPGEDGNLQPLTEHLQLVDGGGTIDVGGDQHHLVALTLKLARELAGGGGLTGALQAHHHDPGDALVRASEARVDRPHQLDQRVVTDLDEVVLRANADLLVALLGDQLDLLTERALFHGAQEILDGLELDVGLEKAQAHVLERLVDDVFGQLAFAGQALTSGPKPLGNGLEHGLWIAPITRPWNRPYSGL